MDRESLYVAVAGCVVFIVIAYGSFWYFSRTETPVLPAPATPAPAQPSPFIPASPPASAPAQAMPFVPTSAPTTAATPPAVGTAPADREERAAPSSTIEQAGQDDEERPRAINTTRTPVEPGRNRNKTPDERKRRRAEYVDD